MAEVKSAAAVIDAVTAVDTQWHDAGALNRPELEAMVRHLGSSRISRSMETGAGVSTLVISHLSDFHEVFTLDVGGSLSSIRTSALLRESSVRFVVGPSQRTLPGHEFSQPLQLALLDGPHAYPFPDLEYFFVYPHLETGALLVIDDIWIPTVFNLFATLREDDMFELIEVINKTAFFRRTAAPVFSVDADNWWEQKYNARRYPLHSWSWARWHQRLAMVPYSPVLREPVRKVRSWRRALIERKG